MSAGGLDRFVAEHAGVPADLVEPGLEVLVPIGLAAASSERPTVIGVARVVRPTGKPDEWWLDVCTASGELAQIYRRGEFLGVPAYGLVPAACGCRVPHGRRPAPG